MSISPHFGGVGRTSGDEEQSYKIRSSDVTRIDYQSSGDGQARSRTITLWSYYAYAYAILHVYSLRCTLTDGVANMITYFYNVSRYRLFVLLYAYAYVCSPLSKQSHIPRIPLFVLLFQAYI